MIAPLLHTSYDWDVAGRTLYGEARGEGHEGLIAVGWVIRNRSEHPGWWGTSVADICTKRSQFSCWNLNDPNREVLLEVKQGNPVFRVCLAVITCVFAGFHEDPTRGATNYFTLAQPLWAVEWPPRWAKAMVKTSQVGAHSFYREARPGEVV